MIKYENQYVKIELNAALATLVHTWRGFAKGQAYREAWEESLRLAKEHNIHHWLINQRDLKGISTEDLRWTYEEWVPKSQREMGAERFTAVVLSENVFDEVALKQSATSLKEKGIVAGYFAQEEFAKQWLADRCCKPLLQTAGRGGAY